MRIRSNPHPWYSFVFTRNGVFVIMLISFIVPVYNVEKYLEKCVSSLVHQQLLANDFEIILIDDGSSDGSGLLCDRLAADNRSIIVVHQNNRGLSEARNMGMKVARGRYIQFVDSDDFLEENVIPRLLKVMEERDLDILRFQIREVDENKKSSLPQFEFSSKETQGVIAGAQYLQCFMGYACYACQFIFRTSLLIENSLWFKSGIIFEDTEWTPRVMNLAKRVSSINILVYNYMVRIGSITRGSAENKTNGQLHIISEMKRQMSEACDINWYEGMIAHLVVSIITTAATTLFHQRKRIIKQLKEMDVFPLSIYHSNIKGRRKINLINCSPDLACVLIHLLN